jgi:hypothetical protein
MDRDMRDRNLMRSDKERVNLFILMELFMTASGTRMKCMEWVVDQLNEGTLYYSSGELAYQGVFACN